MNSKIIRNPDGSITVPVSFERDYGFVDGYQTFQPGTLEYDEWMELERGVLGGQKNND